MKHLIITNISLIFNRKEMETTKNGNTEKLVLPFPYFLWMFGTNPDVLQEKTVMHKPQAETQNTNREKINDEEEK